MKQNNDVNAFYPPFSLNNSYRSKTVPLFYIKLNFG